MVQELQKTSMDFLRRWLRIVKRFYYIGIKDGKSCEGICRSESIDSARQKLSEEGMEEINLAILRSDTVDFLDLETPSEESTSR